MVSGWPHIKILALPFKEVIPFVFLVLSSYLLPIIISCVIYLILICKKRKIFENKVENSNDDKPLHTVPTATSSTATSFLQGQFSNSQGESILQEDLNISDNVQANFEDQIAQNTVIIGQTAPCKNNLDELQTSQFTLENEIRRVSLSLNEETGDIKDRSAAAKFQYPHNPSVIIELDKDQVALPEAFDSTDIEFNQIELDKTRYKIFIKVIFCLSLKFI